MPILVRSIKEWERPYFIPFTREEIAQRIGTVRETVARNLYQLKREKLTDIKPYQIVIRNKEGLQRLLE